MEAKEYLERLLFLDKEISSKIATIQSLKSLAEKCTATLSDIPKSQRLKTKEDIIIKKIILEQKLDLNVDQLIDHKKEAMEKIEGLKQPIYKILLWERYINGKSWVRIAQNLNYSNMQIHRLHSNALKEFQKML